jgi:hypothetical protein
LHQLSHRSRMTEKVSLGFPKGYNEAYRPIAEFAHFMTYMILWAHSVRIHQNCAACD